MAAPVGMDYDITDPGTRNLMMMQAFNATFAGRDGLMEAYKLGEIERAKRKEQTVQAHSMGLLSGMLSGADPQSMMAQFPLADTGVMSNLVASKVAEDRANRARVAEEDAARKRHLFEQEQARILAERAAGEEIASGSAIRNRERPPSTTEQTGTVPAMLSPESAGAPPVTPPLVRPVESVQPPMMQEPAPSNMDTALQPVEPQPDAPWSQTVQDPGMGWQDVPFEAVANEPGVSRVGFLAAREQRQKDEEADRKNKEPGVEQTNRLTAMLLGKSDAEINATVKQVTDSNLLPKADISKAIRDARAGVVPSAEKAGVTANKAAMGRIEAESSPEGQRLFESREQLKAGLRQQFQDKYGRQMNETGLDFAVESMLAGGSMQLSRAKEFLIPFYNRLGQRAEELGMTARDMLANQADRKAAVAGLSQLAKNRDAVEAFEMTTQKNMDLALEVSRRVDRTGIPLANKIIMPAQKWLGNTGIAEWDAAITPVIFEYARVVSTVSGGNITTDSAREEISKLLPPISSPDQVEDVLAIMRQEMQNRIAAYEIQYSSSLGKIRNIGSEAAGVDTGRGAVPTSGKSPRVLELEKKLSIGGE